MLGILANLPTISITKKPLCGSVDLEGAVHGDARPGCSSRRAAGDGAAGAAQQSAAGVHLAGAQDQRAAWFRADTQPALPRGPIGSHVLGRPLEPSLLGKPRLETAGRYNYRPVAAPAPEFAPAPKSEGLLLAATRALLNWLSGR